MEAGIEGSKGHECEGQWREHINDRQDSRRRGSRGELEGELHQPWCLVIMYDFD